MAARAALFLDRDGVLNDPVWDDNAGACESPLCVADVRLAAGASEAVLLAASAAMPVVVVSNQPSAAKGLVPLSALEAVHARVLELLFESGASVTASYLCWHHPDGIDPELGRWCNCRKPAPGLLRRAAVDLDLDLSASWLIGDTDADVGAARTAGLAGVVVVDHPDSTHRRGPESRSSPMHARTADAAVRQVLGQGDAA